MTLRNMHCSCVVANLVPVEVLHGSEGGAVAGEDGVGGGGGEEEQQAEHGWCGVLVYWLTAAGQLPATPHCALHVR